MHATPRRLVRSAGIGACMALALASVEPARADDGDPDLAFGGNGRAIHSWPADTLQVETTAAAAGADGSVIAASWINYPGPQQLGEVAILRWRGDGSPDESFGDSGEVRVDFDPAPRLFEFVRGVFELPDRKVLAFASVERDEDSNDERPALARLHADGTPDESFGAGGKHWVDIPGAPWLDGGELRLRAVARQADGKLVATGSATLCSASPFDTVVLRVLPDGSPDAAFGEGGWQCLGPALPSSGAAVAIDDAGRILVAGGAYAGGGNPDRLMLLRLDATGAPDDGFGDGGIALPSCPLADTSCGATAVLGARREIAGGFYVRRIFVAINQGNRGGILALDDDGAIDEGFADAGHLDLFREEGTRINALALRRDEKLVAAGSINPNGGESGDFFAARSHFDGSLDTDFDGNGVNRYAFDDVAPSIDSANAMVLSAERPVLVGSLHDFGTPAHHTGVLRLQSDTIFNDGFDP